MTSGSVPEELPGSSQSTGMGSAGDGVSHVGG